MFVRVLMVHRTVMARTVRMPWCRVRAGKEFGTWKGAKAVSLATQVVDKRFYRVFIIKLKKDERHQRYSPGILERSH